ncbi:MAG: LysE family translocator [Proteobacteria bacterium]|nr:LysE family translocator [Pseudomonadota bacterium]
MTYELLTGLVLFALVTSITPGPNNLMLMASGANYGFRLTIPHMLGVSLGFMLMAILVGMGLAQLFKTYPFSYILLRVLSVLYLLFLAWKIANAGAPMAASSQSGHPFTFIQAALFQWVNPKAWTMALTAISVYSPSQTLGSVVLVAAVFSAVNLPSVASWTILGREIQRLLTSQKRLITFNICMALLLVLSLYPVLTMEI